MSFFVAGTRKSSELGVVKAISCLAAGMSALDYVEQRVRVVEKDPKADTVGKV